MSDFKAELKQYFVNYFNDLSKDGLPGIFPYYHKPTMLFFQNGVTVLETDAQIEEIFTPTIDSLNAQGYNRMEMTEFNAKALSEDTAMVSNVVVRYRKDGSVLNQASATYTLHKNNKGWKIAAFVIGDAENVIRF